MRRALAIAGIALSTACSVAHPPGAPPGATCEEMGGRCQTADLPCPAGTDWVGHAPCSDRGNACCVGGPIDPYRTDARPAETDAAPAPTDGGATDAGSATSCAEGSGLPGELSCGSAGHCGFDELCCTDGDGPRCLARRDDDARPAPCAECDDDRDCTAHYSSLPFCCAGPFAVGGGERHMCVHSVEECDRMTGAPVCTPGEPCRRIRGLACLEPTVGEVACERGATVCSLEQVCCGTTGGCEPNGAASMEPGAICPLYAECDDDDDCTARGHADAACCVELGLGGHVVHRCSPRDECAMRACDDTGVCTPSPY